MADLTGRVLVGRYQIIDLLGKGGMASVYQARHLQLDRLVAIKVMHDTLANTVNFRARFEREARLVAQLRHPHIIQVFDFDSIETENIYFMVMQLVNGPSLSQYLEQAKQSGMPLPLSETLRISRDVTSALYYAHTQKILHRDIKPSNVLLDEGHDVILSDFGLARLVAADGEAHNFTTSNDLLGTPAYMAPEQTM